MPGADKSIVSPITPQHDQLFVRLVEPAFPQTAFASWYRGGERYVRPANIRCSFASPRL